MTDMAQVDPAYWGQARVQALEVTGDLFGARHRFVFEGHEIHIAVPDIALDDQLYPIARQSHIASFRSGLAKNPTRETNSYEIGYLDAWIRIPRTLTVPQALLDMPPKRPELAGPVLSQELEELTIDYEQRLAGAVAHWKDVVRWITGSRAIDTPGGVPGRQAEAAFEFQGLVAYPGQKRFWTPLSTVVAQRQTGLNAQRWVKIGNVLAAGHDVPIWSRFLDQAFRYLQDWDANGCILACAIACETLAKQTNALSTRKADGTPNSHPARGRPTMSTKHGRPAFCHGQGMDQACPPWVSASSASSASHWKALTTRWQTRRRQPAFSASSPKNWVKR